MQNSVPTSTRHIHWQDCDLCIVNVVLFWAIWLNPLYCQFAQPWPNTDFYCMSPRPIESRLIKCHRDQSNPGSLNVTATNRIQAHCMSLRPIESRLITCQRDQSNPGSLHVTVTNRIQAHHYISPWPIESRLINATGNQHAFDLLFSGVFFVWLRL